MNKDVIIIGLSCFYHDSSVSLLKNDNIIFACQEERFTRKKFDNSFPNNALSYVLNKSNINSSDIDYIVFYEEPELKLDRIYKTLSIYNFKSLKKNYNIIKEWKETKSSIEKYIFKFLPGFKGKIIYSKHHLSHAASAFYPSPFEKSAILTIDGVGEWASSSIGIGDANKISILKEQKYPNSVGILYSTFTNYLGFKILSGEYKLMGLAPYGEPKYVNKIKDKLLQINNNGSIILNKEYFNFLSEYKIYNDNFNKHFNNLKRFPDQKIKNEHCDLASSIQVILEEIVLKMSNHACEITSSNNLCMAGGVALNCVANEKILRNGNCKKLWIQPASGDSGTSLGAALNYLYNEIGYKRLSNKNIQKFSYLGPSFNNDEIKNYLDIYGFKYKKYNKSELYKKISVNLQNQKVLGLFQSNMEFGPRALGNRSIIADPRNIEMQKNLNLKIKFRESFRPFAPIVMYEKASEWFEITDENPYMLITSHLKDSKRVNLTNNEKNVLGLEKLNIKRSEIPSVTHVDYSARIQTVTKETNTFLYNILNEFYKDTSCPILINTSFNVRSEPIVCNPYDALKCFMNTNMDALCIGDYFMIKEDQEKDLLVEENFLKSFDID